jgi:protein involved in polysaccharide export with SLBB domain
LAGNRVFVFGEVKNPGPIAMSGPVSVLQAIAQAGGPLESGTIESVRVVLPNPGGEPKIKTVNLSGISDQATLSSDEILPPLATIYVPPSALATAGRFVDQVVRRIFTFSGIGLGFNYDIRGNNN